MNEGAKQTRQGGLLMACLGPAALLTLAYMVYIGSRLGPTEAGAFYSALFLVFWLCTSVSAVNGTVTRYTSFFLAGGRPGAVLWLHRKLRRWILYGVGITLGLYLVGGWAVSAALRFPSALVLPLCLLVFFTNAWLALHRGLLRGHHRFGAFGLTFIAEGLPRAGSMVPALWLSPTTAMGLVSYWAGTAGATLSAWAFSRADLRRLRRRVGEAASGLQRLDQRGSAEARGIAGPTAEVRRYLLLYLAMVGVGAAFQNADMLLVRRYFEGPLVGAYGAASALAKGVEVVNLAISGLLLPVLTDAFARGRPLWGPFLRLLGLFAVSAAVPLSAFYFVPNEMIRLFYGEDFVAGAPLLWLLGLSGLLTALANILCQAYNAAGRFGFMAPFTLGLAAEVLSVVLYHPDLFAVVHLVLGVKTVTLLLMTPPLFWIRPAR